jgi:hypothetical protein
VGKGQEAGAVAFTSGNQTRPTGWGHHWGLAYKKDIDRCQKTSVYKGQGGMPHLTISMPPDLSLGVGLSHPGYRDEWQLGPDLSFGMGLGHRDEWHSDLSLGVGLSHPDYRDEWQLSPDLSFGMGLGHPGYRDVAVRPLFGGGPESSGLS